jgi:hypothetical protein
MPRLYRYLVWCIVWTAFAGYCAAAPVTYRFETTIDARSKGLGEYESLAVVYTFDTGVSAGTGPFGSTANSNSYGLISLSITIADQTVSGTGGGITVFNDALITYIEHTAIEDGYDVRAENYSGTLFGETVTFFRFLLVDNDYDMLSGTGLPLNTDFNLQADYQAVDIFLSDSSILNILEHTNTPEGDLRLFTLTAIPEPSATAVILSVFALGAVFFRRGTVRFTKTV